MEALFGCRKTSIIGETQWDSPSYREYISNWHKKQKIFYIKANLFDKKGTLKPIKPTAWEESFFKVKDALELPPDDDLPF